MNVQAIDTIHGDRGLVLTTLYWLLPISRYTRVIFSVEKKVITLETYHLSLVKLKKILFTSLVTLF